VPFNSTKINGDAPVAAVFTEAGVYHGVLFTRSAATSATSASAASFVTTTAASTLVTCTGGAFVASPLIAVLRLLTPAGIVFTNDFFVMLDLLGGRRYSQRWHRYESDGSQYQSYLFHWVPPCLAGWQPRQK